MNLEQFTYSYRFDKVVMNTTRCQTADRTAHINEQIKIFEAFQFRASFDVRMNTVPSAVLQLVAFKDILCQNDNLVS